MRKNRARKMPAKGENRKIEASPESRGYEIEHLGYELYTMIHINCVAKLEAPSPLLVEAQDASAHLPAYARIHDLPQLTEVLESWSFDEAMAICERARVEALAYAARVGKKLDIGLNNFFVADYMRTNSKVNGEMLHQEVRLKVSKVYAAGTEIGELEVEMMRTSGAQIPDEIKRMVRGPFGIMAQVFEEAEIIPAPDSDAWKAGILPMSMQPPMEQP